MKLQTVHAQSHVMHQYTADDAMVYNGDEIHWKLCHNSKVSVAVQPLSQYMYFFGSHSNTFLSEVIG